MCIRDSYCDVATGEFCVEQLPDETQLMNELTRIKPREILVADSCVKKMLTLTEKTRFKNTFVNPYFDWAFEQTAAKKALCGHFKVKSLSGFGCGELSDAICAAGALMQYLVDTQKNALLHITAIKTLTGSSYMVLDPSTRRNLELTQTFMENGKKGSLLWLLDRTKTAMGARLLKKLILQPLKSIDAIDERLDAVGEIKDDMYLRNSLVDYLGSIYDLERIISRISYGTIDAKDCLSLKRSIAALPTLKALLENSKSALLKDIYEKMDDLQEMCIRDSGSAGLLVHENNTDRHGFVFGTVWHELGTDVRCNLYHTDPARCLLLLCSKIFRAGPDRWSGQRPVSYTHLDVYKRQDESRPHQEKSGYPGGKWFRWPGDQRAGGTD